jgi:hypothetical protein
MGSVVSSQREHPGNTGTEGSDIGVVLDTKSKKEKER